MTKKLQWTCDKCAKKCTLSFLTSSIIPLPQNCLFDKEKKASWQIKGIENEKK
jgi:hypothetical protein